MLFEHAEDRFALGTATSAGLDVFLCDARERRTSIGIEASTASKIVCPWRTPVKLQWRDSLPSGPRRAIQDLRCLAQSFVQQRAARCSGAAWRQRTRDLFDPAGSLVFADRALAKRIVLRGTRLVEERDHLIGRQHLRHDPGAIGPAVVEAHDPWPAAACLCQFLHGRCEIVVAHRASHRKGISATRQDLAHKQPPDRIPHFVPA